MKNKQASNGVDNVLTPQLQQIREQIVVDELKARHWRAQYETAYYHLQFEKILPEYTDLLQRLQKEREEMLQANQEAVEKMLKEADEATLEQSGIKIEEAN